MVSPVSLKMGMGEQKEHIWHLGLQYCSCALEKTGWPRNIMSNILNKFGLKARNQASYNIKNRRIIPVFTQTYIKDSSCSISLWKFPLYFGTLSRLYTHTHIVSLIRTRLKSPFPATPWTLPRASQLFGGWGEEVRKEIETQWPQTSC